MQVLRIDFSLEETWMEQFRMLWIQLLSFIKLVQNLGMLLFKSITIIIYIFFIFKLHYDILLCLMYIKAPNTFIERDSKNVHVFNLAFVLLPLPRKKVVPMTTGIKPHVMQPNMCWS